MTAAATAAPPAAAEETLRARALDLIRTQSLEAVLASDEPVRTVDLTRLIAERLQLRLTEEEMGGLASVVRLLLDSDPLFSQANRQWDLALRMGRAEGDRRKPVERAIADFIELLGRPSPIDPIATLASAVYGRPPEYFETLIDRIAPSNSHFFRVDRSLFGVRRWLLDLSSDDPEEVEYDNFDDASPLGELQKAARAAKGGDPVSYALSLVTRADRPVGNRALQYLTWRAFPDLDPKELFIDLITEGSLVLERGAAWTTEPEHARVLEAIRTLAGQPDEVSELVAAALPAEEEEIGILAPAVIRVSDEDLDMVFDFMSRESRPYRVAELCQQALEAFPGSRTYPAVHESLMNRLRDDPRFQWAGLERFRIAGTTPAEVEVLPEGLTFDVRDYLGEDEAEVDKFLDPRDWKFNLDEQVKHYLVQDVGDDETVPADTPPSELVVSPPLHHYVAGTLYLRNCDQGFFPATPDLLQVTLLSDDTRQDVWVNNRLGLVFDMKEWYEANLPWVGGRFAVQRTDQPDEYRLVYSGEVGPLMDIPLDRLQQLLQLRADAATEAMPLTTVVERILRGCEEGLHLVSLFTQVNVVRRARRAQLASILSAQRYFVQTLQEPGIWRFDEKRAAKPKGKKKGGPKRGARELYEEEDEAIQYE